MQGDLRSRDSWDRAFMGPSVGRRGAPDEVGLAFLLGKLFGPASESSVRGA